MGINLIKSFFDPSQVSFLIFYVTNRCNFRCDFCFYYNEIGKGRKPDELSLSEIDKLSRKIGPLIQLSLTGGEPFLREDLSGITESFIKNTGAAYITIPTNAYLTGKISDYLAKILPRYPDTYFRLVFSIDGIGEAHDRIRSFPGAYKGVIDSYNAVGPLRKKYKNLVLDVNTVYTLNTQKAIIETLKSIREQFDFDNYSVTLARGDIKKPALKEVSFDTYIELNNFLQSIERTKEARRFYYVWRGVRDVSRDYLIRTVYKDEFITPCVAGRKLLVIAETGDVYPCEILNKKMGNLRDYDFDIKALLKHADNVEMLRWIRNSRCKCSFECALAANVLWGRGSFFRLLAASLRNIGKRRIGDS